jgi:hypothetical protein
MNGACAPIWPGDVRIAVEAIAAGFIARAVVTYTATGIEVEPDEIREEGNRRLCSLRYFRLDGVPAADNTDRRLRAALIAEADKVLGSVAERRAAEGDAVQQSRGGG